MAGSTKVKARQTPIDIAIQQGGTAEEIFTVAALNGISITDNLVSGATVNYGEVSVIEVAEYFRKYGRYPGSGSNTLSDGLPGGIDYMIIGLDFKVR
jgi:hypothetical protein